MIERRRNILLRSIKYFVALVMAAAPSVTMYYVLKAEGPLWALVAFSLTITVLFILNTLIENRLARIILNVSVAVIMIAGAGAIAIALNLTPASAYIVWFRLVRDGTASGTISYMFCLKFSVLTALFAGLMCTKKFFVSIFGYLFFNAILLAAIYQSDVFIAAASASFLLFVMYLAISHYRKVKIRALFSSVQVIILVLLVAWPLTLTKTSTRSILIDSVSDERLSAMVIRLFPRFPFLYNMPGYGYTFGQRTIGARPSLTSRPVFRVSGDPGETMYLRTNVYSVYTGSGWAMDPELIADASVGYRFRDFVRQSPLVRPRGAKEIEVLIDFYSSLPHTLETSYLSMRRREIPNIQYGSRDVGYLLKDPVTRGQTILMYEERDKETPSEDLAISKFLQIPDSVPRQVIQEARRIGGGGTQDEVLGRIKAYLNGFSYTLETESTNPGIDAVENFLFNSKRGYCVHFATAYALLARINGIPTRYSTGFLVNIPSSADETIVTGYSAHAWPEVWDSEKGWYPREATPPMSSEYYNDPDYYEMFGMEDSDYTLLQLEAIMGDRVGALRQTDENGVVYIPYPEIGYVVGGILLVLGVIWITTHSIIFRLSTTTKAKYVGRKLLDLAAKQGLSSPLDVGWQGWATSVSERFPDAGQKAFRVASIIQAGFFGGGEIERRDVRFMRMFAGRYLR